MTRRLLVAALALSVFSALGTSAASLGTLNSHNLGASGAVVASCDNDVTVSYTLAAGNTVDTVTVSGLHADCVGGQLQLTLSNGSGTSVASGSAGPITSTSILVDVTPNPAVANVLNVDIAIVGP